MNLWPEDMPPGSVVLLSGNDDLVHADEVRMMLEQSGSHIKVMYNPHLWHGAFLLDPEVKRGLASEIRGMLARTGSLAYRLTKPVAARAVHAARSVLSTVGSLAAEPSGLFAALSGTVLGGAFSVGGAAGAAAAAAARRRRAATDAGAAAAAGAAGARRSGLGGGGGNGGGAAAPAAAAANGGRPGAAGGSGSSGSGGSGSGGGDALDPAPADGAASGSGGANGGAWPALSAQHSLDRAVMLCSAVLEEKLDVLEAASSTDRAAAGAAMIAEATAAALRGGGAPGGGGGGDACAPAPVPAAAAAGRPVGGASSLGSPRLPPMGSCREAVSSLVQRRRQRPGGGGGDGDE